MPLILTVEEGDEIYIGPEDYVKVLSVISDGLVRCRLGDEDQKIVDVADKKSTEIFPDVFMSAGLKSKNRRLIRLLFNAPREIEIGRYDPLEVSP